MNQKLSFLASLSSVFDLVSLQSKKFKQALMP